jgi:hypothetical protein
MECYVCKENLTKGYVVRKVKGPVSAYRKTRPMHKKCALKYDAWIKGPDLGYW